MVNRVEALGPAERIIQALLTHQDHLYHGRSGVVLPAPTVAGGVQWFPVTWRMKDNVKRVFQLGKIKKKSIEAEIGTLRADGKIVENGKVVGEFREPGLFPEIVAYVYKTIADVYKMDNEFAAKWASYAYGQEHRDLKMVLAAFMLVQPRKGDPVVDAGKVAFYDADYRDVGEAMILLHVKKDKEDKTFEPKMLLRIRKVLMLPQIAALNVELGFTASARHPFLGRWETVVTKWLKHREDNPKLLDGLIKAGYRTTLKRLAALAHYKPSTPKFYEALRWKQHQSKAGHRVLAIGEAVKAAETWEGLDEKAVCEKIVATRYDWKRITGLLPAKLGITRAIVAAAIQVNALTSKDLVILTPTLEELGLLKVVAIKERWEKAMAAANDMRAANIARNVRSTEVKEKLENAADAALQKEVAKVMRNMRAYFIIDISASMQGAIEAAIVMISKFLQGFPPDKLHVAVFNTTGREVKIPHASAAGVKNAFVGIKAGGGTDYGAGVTALKHHKPKDDEDVIMFFVGDEEAGTFDNTVKSSGLSPVAFGLLKTVPTGAAAYRVAQWGADRNVAVRGTAERLGIPCFEINEKTFEDPYAISRTIPALIAATPVTTPLVATPKATPRVTLIDQILATELLTKPVWA